MKKCILILCSLLAACGPALESESVSSDGNIKSLITDHTQKTVRISLPNFANEVVLIDSYDLNGDGIAEFIIAPSVDPEAQLQISGNVPKSRLSELEKLMLYGGLAQLARAPALHAGGHRFDSDILHHKRMLECNNASINEIEAMKH